MTVTIVEQIAVGKERDLLESMIKADGTVTVTREILEQRLTAYNKLELWERVERIVGAELGPRSSEIDKYYFNRKRNQLFLKVIIDGIDLAPLEALNDL